MAARWVRTRVCACGNCRFRPLFAGRCPAMVPDHDGEYRFRPVQLWALEVSTEDEDDGWKELQGKRKGR